MEESIRRAVIGDTRTMMKKRTKTKTNKKKIYNIEPLQIYKNNKSNPEQIKQNQKIIKTINQNQNKN